MNILIALFKECSMAVQVQVEGKGVTLNPVNCYLPNYTKVNHVPCENTKIKPFMA